jgi:hypothetical protein
VGAPPQYVGTAYRTRRAHEECLQMDLLGGTAEHLLETEGIRSAVATTDPKKCWKPAACGVRVDGCARLGTGSGDRE